ncbi:MAG: response regulator [Planctomycetes bacterium]|nr:response regulator [Planctomycetota bacterium]
MPEAPGDSLPKVLVIEDDEASRKLLSDLLRKEGYSPILTSDGEEALAWLETHVPDLVFCDLALPRVGGLEVVRRLRHREATRLVPVIVLTGHAELQNKLDALDAGADDFLTKPFNVLEVAARARSLLRNRRLTQALEDAQNVVFALATAIEHKDDYTEGHGERVAVYARSLAEFAGLSPADVQAVHTGGILHDVGKIGCPDAILNKPGPLTPEEFEIIKRHPTDGWEICRHLRSMPHLSLCCIRNHHEKLDGSGYPDGQADGAIPVAVRIMSISDVFDALATARAYKPAFPTDTCFRILREESERGWWDGDLVEKFIAMMRERELDVPVNRAKLEPILPQRAPNGPSPQQVLDVLHKAQRKQ